MTENRDTKFGHPDRPDLEAAPPDDGGHQGSYTRPQDMLQEPQQTGSAEGERRPAPDLHYVDRLPHTGGSRAPVVALVGVLLIGVLLLILFMYAYYSPG